MYHFYMPIGDWSGDGHGAVEHFLVSSNKPVAEIREAHYKISEATGIDIEKICNLYEEDCIQPAVMSKLWDLGWKIVHGIPDSNMPAAQDMASLWVFLLMKADPSLKLEIIPQEYATLPFCGCDDKGRHIGGVGYGLFT